MHVLGDWRQTRPATKWSSKLHAGHDLIGAYWP